MLALILTDVYSSERIAAHHEPGPRRPLRARSGKLIEQERPGQGEVLYRVRRLPDDVRVVGDKALFDSGLLGLRQVKGYDLEDLGSRAYRLGRARRWSCSRRTGGSGSSSSRISLLVLPLEEEVVFLRQCSERVPSVRHASSSGIQTRPSHEAGAGRGRSDHAAGPPDGGGGGGALGTTDELTWSSPAASLRRSITAAAGDSGRRAPCAVRDEHDLGVLRAARPVLLGGCRSSAQAALRSVVVDQDLRQSRRSATS